jgi:hypothetical protein
VTREMKANAMNWWKDNHATHRYEQGSTTTRAKCDLPFDPLLAAAYGAVGVQELRLGVLDAIHLESIRRFGKAFIA